MRRTDTRAAQRLLTLLAVIIVSSLSATLAGGTRAATSPFVAVDLGKLPPGFITAANDSGQVIGVDDPSVGNHAFSWTQASGTVVLSLGGSSSRAMALSGRGQVVGYSMLAGDTAQHAFSWTQSGGLVDLGTLGGTRSNALAVNNSGQVVGWSMLPGDTVSHAFTWTQAGGMHDLGALSGSTVGAHAVSDAGEVTGLMTTTSGAFRVFTWTQSGGMVDHGWPFGNIVANNWELSNTGQIVTNGFVSGGVHAVSWTPADGWIDLGTLGGSTSYAYGVNDSGQIVGESLPAGSNSQCAFSWTKAGGMVSLCPQGAAPSRALAVNASGQVAGVMASGSYVHAFSWTTAGGLVDLGTLGGLLSNAYALSQAGTVVGYSNTTTGETHLALWRDVLAPVAPSTPDLATVSDNGDSSTDNVTSLSTLAFTGTAEPSSTVTLFRGVTAVGAASASFSDGAWSISDAVPAVGSYSYTATATDAAGNTSVASPALAVTVIAPTLSGGGSGGGGSGNSGSAAVTTTQPVVTSTTPIVTSTPTTGVFTPSTAVVVKPVIAKAVDRAFQARRRQDRDGQLQGDP